MFEMVIVADSNDGDYVTSISDITQDELNELIPVIDAIREFGKTNPHAMNWPDMWDSRHGQDLESTYPDLTEDQIELFRDYVPSIEGGVHSIESITYYLKPKKIVLI